MCKSQLQFSHYSITFNTLARKAWVQIYPMTSIVGQQHILVLNYVAPRHGTGSEIVLFRHLMKLSEIGWQVTICSPDADKIGTDFRVPDWTYIQPPMRKWWWPPYRQSSPLLESLRAFAIAQFVKKELRRRDLPSPRVVLTNLWSYFARAAAEFSKITGARLITLLHDQQEFWAESQTEYKMCRDRVSMVARQSTFLGAVSQPLLDAYGLAPPNAHLLLPIPGEIQYVQVTETERPREFIIGHAGSLHEFQYENLSLLAHCLSKLGGKLLLICPSTNPTHLKLVERFSNIISVEFFKENESAISHLAENCAGLLVSYSFSSAKQQWATSSFPSKFLEYCRTGLPVLLLAPEESATGRWAKENAWSLFMSALDEDLLDQKLEYLRHSDNWSREAARTRQLASSEFSAATIHQTLLDQMARPPHRG
jgi:hypothetical protein